MSKPAMICVLIIAALAACQPKEVNVKYTLSDEQLSRLMFDLQLSDIAISEAKGESRDSLSELIWHRLTEIYKLSKPELAEEIHKLETDPVKMQSIMDQVQVMSDSIQ